MRQVFYIEADEEMISVIGRLRKSTATENVIVAPYRSLILQSIVNLRLLSHDARKNGKEIIVVTQDEQSRSLCEKAGIRTQSALEGEGSGMMMQQQMQRYSDMAPATPAVTPGVPSGQQGDQGGMQQRDQAASGKDVSVAAQLPHSDSIGTSDFFADPHAIPLSQSAPSLPRFEPSPQQQRQQQQTASKESFSGPSYGDVKRVQVRDSNPKKLTSLNSVRFEEEARMKQQKSFTPPSLRGTTPVRPVFMPMPPVATPAPLVGSVSPASSFQAPMSAATASRSDMAKHTLPDFLLHRDENEIASTAAKKMPEKPISVSGGGKMKAFFIFFGFISVLSVAGVGAYLFLPKADVQVKLKVSAQKSDFEFDGSSSEIAASADSRTIPVRLIEKDQDVSLSFDATGKTSLADQKARGSVTIYNEYSADPQILVASTRLQSEDGKMFRLLSSVTVPGMTTVSGTVQPGMAEATVMADQSGQEYNVAATSFTIPGFQGGPKYDKFYGKSAKAMTGGGTSGADVTAVSDADVASAKKSVEAKIKDLASGIANADLAPGEKVLDEAVDASIVSSGASPQSGAVTNSFDYRVKLHVKALVFSETDLKKMVGTLFTQQNTAKGISSTPGSIDLQYGEPTADFVGKTLRIKVHAVGRTESSLDETQLKADLLGQDENSLDDLLKKYTQIDKISVALWPEFLTSKIPTREDRVNINVESFDAGAGK